MARKSDRRSPGPRSLPCFDSVLLNKMEPFDQRVNEYFENSSKASPIGIWFEKLTDKRDEAKCLHGPFRKYNAAKDFQRLSSIKTERKVASKRRNEDNADDNRPSKKQKMVFQCAEASAPQCRSINVETLEKKFSSVAPSD